MQNKPVKGDYYLSHISPGSNYNNIPIDEHEAIMLKMEESKHRGQKVKVAKIVKIVQRNRKNHQTVSIFLKVPHLFKKKGDLKKVLSDVKHRFKGFIHSPYEKGVEFLITK